MVKFLIFLLASIIVLALLKELFNIDIDFLMEHVIAYLKTFINVFEGN